MKSKREAPGAERPLADEIDRRAIRTELDVNMVVEAGAGSGKTHSLAGRMVEGIVTGKYRVDEMAAVTFTRKAAAELRGRFQQALEERLRDETDAACRARLREALAGLERLFAGTIHSFCAHLLRERPVEAHLAPGFTEMEDLEDLATRRASWDAFVARARAIGSPVLHDLEEAGVRAADLVDAFATLCTFEEVHFPAGDAASPDLAGAWTAFDRFWAAVSKRLPPTTGDQTTCPVQQKARETNWRIDLARRDRLGDLVQVFELWEKPLKCTQIRWDENDRARGRTIALEVDKIVADFRDAAVPVLAEARHYIYRLAITLLCEAREFAREARYADLTLNYNDLLRGAWQLLQERPAVRRALQQKFRWLFVDEFQDTDPIQAEIMLMLAADESRVQSEGREDATIAPWSVALRPGALFVVGDPKQSIFRFRRADIQSYNSVRDRLVETGGRMVRLTTSFRALPCLCAWNNDVFRSIFPTSATDEQPPFQELADHRHEEAAAGPPASPIDSGLRLLTTGGDRARTDVAECDAAAMARYIRREIDRGRRTAGAFMIITWKKKELSTYAAALRALDVPVEISGGAGFAESTHVRTLAALLRALADPRDEVAVVGTLRGPLFGIEDDDLFEHRRAGGWFSYLQAAGGRRQAEGGEQNPAGKPRRQAGGSGTADQRNGSAKKPGPVEAALAEMYDLYDITRELPLAAAIEKILELTGLLALAAADPPGGGEAGDLLQLVGLTRSFASDGYTLGGIAEELGALLEDGEMESLPLEPGRTDVVRVMNLHKAKGLEADVVFLADPCGGSKMAGQVAVRIDRTTLPVSGGRPAGTGAAPAAAVVTPPRGYLRLVQKIEGNGFTRDKLLGEPPDWAAHEAAERPFVLAEVKRLLYVAATRARDLLVVSRWAGTDKRPVRPWQELEGHLLEARELAVPESVVMRARPAIDMTDAARKRFDADLTDRLRSSRTPSFAVQSPSRSPERDVVLREDDGARLLRGPDTGMEWGTLVHKLLEFGTRHATAGRADLERFALWLTLDNPGQRSVATQAVGVVLGVLSSEEWQQARAAGECHVEVPFALRLAGAGSGQGGSGAAVASLGFEATEWSETGPDAACRPSRPQPPVVVTGIIDLVYRTREGWRIVDHKTDQLAEKDASTLLDRHADQIDSYTSAWKTITGAPVRAGLHVVRTGEIVWRR